ncbi:MAG: DUF58 domain-containing protein [Verrucomicrobiota bacterium]
MAKKTKPTPKPKANSGSKSSEKEGISAFLNPAEMHTLGRLLLHSRYTVEGNLSGAHRSPLKGPSSEFADHKSYGLGDEIKHIDWRVVARTDKYFIKRFEDETNLRVYLALDRSNSMNYTSGKGPTKFDFACHFAAALSYVVVKSRDSVGLYMYSDKVDLRMESANSLQHLNNMFKYIQASPPMTGGGTGLAETLHEIAGTVRRRALVIVISDLLTNEDDVVKALAHCRKMRHDMLVFQVLDPAEIDLSFKGASELRDLESGEKMQVNARGLAAEYTKVFGEFLEKYQKACAGMNIDYRMVRTDQPVETFIRAYLEERRRCSR